MAKLKAVGIKMRHKGHVRFVFDKDGELVGQDSEIEIHEDEGRFYTPIVTSGCNCQLCVSDLDGAGFKKDGNKVYLPEWASEQIKAKLLEFRLNESLGKEEADG